VIGVSATHEVVEVRLGLIGECRSSLGHVGKAARTIQSCTVEATAERTGIRAHLRQLGASLSIHPRMTVATSTCRSFSPVAGAFVPIWTYLGPG